MAQARVVAMEIETQNAQVSEVFQRKNQRDSVLHSNHGAGAKSEHLIPLSSEKITLSPC